MTTAFFNTAIETNFLYYSKYSDTYDLDAVITVEGITGPYRYVLLEHAETVYIDKNILNLNGGSYGPLTILVMSEKDSIEVSTIITGKYAVMNERYHSKEYQDGYKRFKEYYPSFVANRIKNG